jgi:hypothetical protein
MGKFGWSYPPGCYGTPYDEDHPCEVCGEFEDDCICPECPECGGYGYPDCYINHGLVKTEAQIKSLKEKEEMWEAESKIDEEWEPLEDITTIKYDDKEVFVSNSD